MISSSESKSLKLVASSTSLLLVDNRQKIAMPEDKKIKRNGKRMLSPLREGHFDPGDPDYDRVYLNGKKVATVARNP
jgi:hypothetical protein